MVPGGRSFSCTTSPAMIICGTRAGTAKHKRYGVNPGVMLAPIDLDPGSVQWPVKDAPGLLVLACEADKEFVLRLVQACLSDGAKMICVLREGEPASFHHEAPTL